MPGLSGLGSERQLYDIGNIKARHDILDVAERLGLEIVRHGPLRSTARCFRQDKHLHGDKNPSAVIDRENQIYRCWVCYDKPLDVIDLVCDFLGVDFREACEWLEKGYVEPRTEKAKVFTPNYKLTKDRLQIVRAFYDLCDPQADYLYRYLMARGITPESIKKFGFRYCHSSQDAERELLKSFTKQQLLEAGLISPNNEKQTLLPFSKRVIYPFTYCGNIVYLQGRAIYQNPKYPKMGMCGRVPYPFNFDNLRRARKVLICEGVEDAVIAHQIGFTPLGVIGINGFKTDWIPFLKGKKVLLAFDNEKNALEASWELGKKIMNFGIDVKIISELMNEGEDINEYYYRLTTEGFSKDYIFSTLDK